MTMFVLQQQKDYQLLDSGNGEKLERFGKYILSRPDPKVLWFKKLPISAWEKADAVFNPSKKINNDHWENRDVKEPWIFTFENIKMNLHLSPFKHVGVFPEQIINWQWFGKLITKYKIEDIRYQPKILNLFGYTGGATLYAASKGASVTHVDASKPSIIWARENQKLSGLERAPIRWIVDDAKKFVAREVKRGVKYNAVILDPPAFGRDSKGKVFKFEKDVPELLQSIKKVLLPKPLFILFNSYSLGYSPTVIKNILSEILPIEKIESGELEISEKSGGRNLPCGIFAKYEGGGESLSRGF